MQNNQIIRKYTKNTKKKQNMCYQCKEEKIVNYENNLLKKQIGNLIVFEDMFFLSNDIQCIVGFDSYYKLVNGAFESAFGYTNKEIKSKSIFKYIHDDDKKKCKVIISKLMKGEHINSFRNRFICKDGSTKLVEWSATSKLERENIYLIGRDVSLQKETEEELDKTKERNEIILESITDSFFALDHNMRIIYINNQAVFLFGKKREDMLNKKINQISLECFDSNVLQKIKTAMEKKVFMHFETLSLDERSWYEYSLYPSKEGLSVFFVDITQRKKTEEILRKSEERFKKTFKYGSNIMFIVNQKGLINNVNKNGENIIGIDYNDLIGKHITKVFEISNAKDNAFEEESIINMEVDFNTKEHGRRSGILFKEKILISNKEYYLYTIVDVTEIKNINAKVAKMERLNLVAQMAAGVAHEIRNPLTTVHGFLQIFKKKENYKEYASYIDLMLSELDRTSKIISEFLSLARNKPSDLKLQNINDIILKLLPLICADAIHYNIDVETSLNPVTDQLLNESEMRQLILNMAKNGIEAMKTNGKLTIKTYMENGMIVLAFIDQGPGIPIEIQDRIGTPFFSTKDKGTGLGIAICTGIVNRHNGEIVVETDQTGTTFYIYFKTYT